MGKTVYITEEQEQEIVNKYLSEALVVNSGQVSDIVNYLNNFYKAGVDYAGDVGVDGLPCQTLGINYIVNGQPLQKLKREELLDVINDKFRHFIKDDASRLAYYNQIIDDWLNKRVKLTGQLSVNVIGDDMVNKFKNYKKQPKQDNDDKKDDKKDDKTQSINEEIEELGVKHASASKFDNFDSSYMGTGCGSQAYGWGHYFSTDKDVHNGYKKWSKEHPNYDPQSKKMSAYSYDVEIPDDNGSNYILWDGPPIKDLPGDDKSTFGEQYSVLSYKLGSDKAASMFLAKRGYTGIKVPPFRNSRNGEVINNPKEKYNYIVFNDNDANITNRKTVYSKTPKLYNGNIFINKGNGSSGRLFNPETGVDMFKPIVVDDQNGNKITIKPIILNAENGFYITYDNYNSAGGVKQNFLNSKTGKLLYPDNNPLNWPYQIRQCSNQNIYRIVPTSWTYNWNGKYILMRSYTKEPLLGDMNNPDTGVMLDEKYDYKTGITIFYLDFNKTQPIFIGKDGNVYKTEEECRRAARGFLGAVRDTLNQPIFGSRK